MDSARDLIDLYDDVDVVMPWRSLPLVAASTRMGSLNDLGPDSG